MVYIKNRDILLFFLVAFIVIVPRAAFLNVNEGLWWDEAVYLGLAKNIEEGRGYQINSGMESFRPPLFPLILSFFHENEFLINFISPFFGVLGIIVTGLFAREMYGNRVAIIAMLFLASSSLFLFFGQKILTETIFLFIFTSSIFSFYLALEKNKKNYFIPAGFFMAIAILTRYTGLLIIPIVFLIIILKYINKIDGKKLIKNIRSYEFAAGILTFIFILAPWVAFNSLIYGDPFWSIENSFAASREVTIYDGPPNFYINNSFQIFGLSLIFIIPFFIFFKKKDLFLFLTIITIFLIFSVGLERKEIRYLVPFSSIFFIMLAAGTNKLMRWFERNSIVNLIPYFLVGLSIFIGLFIGAQMTIENSTSGLALIQAAEYVNKNSEGGSVVIAENYPVVNFVGERKVIQFPDSESEFRNLIESEDVSFVIVDTIEPTNPDYVKGFNESNLIRSFSIGNENVNVYRFV